MGFGDTPETPDDYQLADSNYANRKLTVVGIGKNTPALGDIFSVFANFSNDGAENVIVKEIGIVGNPTDSSTTANLCLLYRKVLDSPITIAPGEIYNFSYRVRIKTT